jgi:hypothetical protein
VDKGPDFAPRKNVPNDIVIATPGPNKHGLTKGGGLLAPLWSGALAAIKAAEDIVFLGYRFPPSDAYAREKLLGAIRENEARDLQIRVVLGPDISHRDVVRMLGLLTGVLTAAGRLDSSAPQGSSPTPVRLFDLEARPFYAEDFLAVFDPENLSVSSGGKA